MIRLDVEHPLTRGCSTTNLMNRAGSKLLQLIHETMIGCELGDPMIIVRIANLTQAYSCGGKSNNVVNRGNSMNVGIVQ
jgi:hypothetical protein